jgi:hypothetical protein
MADTQNTQAPAHAIEVTIKIGAHDKKGLLCFLEEATSEAKNATSDYFGGMLSAGCSGSYSVDVQRRNVTAEQYQQELNEWLEKGRDN